MFFVDCDRCSVLPRRGVTAPRPGRRALPRRGVMAPRTRKKSSTLRSDCMLLEIPISTYHEKQSRRSSWQKEHGTEAHASNTTQYQCLYVGGITFDWVRGSQNSRGQTHNEHTRTKLSSLKRVLSTLTGESEDAGNWKQVSVPIM